MFLMLRFDSTTTTLKHGNANPFKGVHSVTQGIVLNIKRGPIYYL
jgi:hypothetical protein